MSHSFIKQLLIFSLILNKTEEILIRTLKHLSVQNIITLHKVTNYTISI